MHDTQMSGRPTLEMRWLPMTDEHGTTRVEAVWVDLAVAPTTAHHAA